jgi:hypothetical protein
VQFLAHAARVDLYCTLNRDGGYVGVQPFFVLIRDSQVVQREMGPYVVRDGFLPLNSAR